MTSLRAASPLLFTTAGTLGPVGTWGWLLGELPEPIKVRGDESVIRKYVLAVLVAAAEVVILSAGRRKP